MHQIHMEDMDGGRPGKKRAGNDPAAGKDDEGQGGAGPREKNRRPAEIHQRRNQGARQGLGRPAHRAGARHRPAGKGSYRLSSDP